MSLFKKAVPIDSPLKMSLYGAPGSGKSFTALLFAEGLARVRGKRIAYVDTEFSTKTYRRSIPERRVHPEAFDFDVIDTRSLDETLRAIKSIDPKEHGVVVIDSISRLWDAAREAYVAKNPGADDIPIRAWSVIKRPYKEMMNILMAGPYDVLILGREKTLFGKDDSGKLENQGVGMRAEGETQYEPDNCARMEMNGLRGEEEGVPTMFFEKDRYGILSGRKYPRPNFKTIEPLVKYLGTEAPKSQTDDEAAEQDAGLLVEGEERLAKKAEKSAGILADMQGRILAAQTVEALGSIAAEMKKQKRYLMDEHDAALRTVFDSRRDQIVKQLTGA